MLEGGATSDRILIELSLVLLTASPSQIPIDFRVASCRGMEVGCEAPHLQSILRILRMGVVPSWLSMHLHIQPFRVG